MKQKRQRLARIGTEAPRFRRTFLINLTQKKKERERGGADLSTSPPGSVLLGAVTLVSLDRHVTQSTRRARRVAMTGPQKSERRTPRTTPHRGVVEVPNRATGEDDLRRAGGVRPYHPPEASGLSHIRPESTGALKQRILIDPSGFQGYKQGGQDMANHCQHLIGGHE